MRGGADLEGLEAVVAADAVFLVDDEVALGDFGGFGDELVGALAAARRAGMRSPRRSCSPTMAISPSVKPRSRPRVITGMVVAGSLRRADQVSSGSAGMAFSRRRWVRRSREPRVQAARMVRRFSAAACGLGFELGEDVFGRAGAGLGENGAGAGAGSMPGARRGGLGGEEHGGPAASMASHSARSR